MRVVVTGASGFIGRRLVTEFANAGHTGLAVSRQAGLLVPPGWSSVRRSALLEADEQVGVDALVHLEVKQHVINPTKKDLLECETTNVGGAKAWLDWATRNEVPRFVYFSSIKAVVTAPVGTTLESASGPHSSPYGSSKWRAEEAVRQWASEGGLTRGALILRPAVVYGPGNGANVAAMVDAIRKGRFFLIGRNDNIKSLISVGNVVAATRHLLERVALGSADVYNLCDREKFTVRELDCRIRSLIGKTGNSRSLPLPVARGLALMGDLYFRLTKKTFPINSTRLEALIEPTEFSCAKLQATGFQQPEAALTGLVESLP